MSEADFPLVLNSEVEKPTENEDFKNKTLMTDQGDRKQLDVTSKCEVYEKAQVGYSMI